MNTWLDPVRRALAFDVAPVTFFFRDDDAGWEDDKLYQLLDVVAGFRVPIALAAIPAAVRAGLAAELRRLVTTRTQLVSVHQHGFAHTNHEPTGRRSEFGVSRARDLQRQDLANGRERLQHALGFALPPIFTPPWNRCTRDTTACLVELGFQVLSRDVSADPLGAGSIQELPVCLDWTGHRGARLGPVRWGETIARAIAPGATIGIMLHHAIMTADDRRMLSDLLQVLEGGPHATVRQMFDIAASGRPLNREFREGHQSCEY
jgi:predicted deacetylase